MQTGSGTRAATTTRLADVSGDYFGNGAPSCSELQGDCVWVLSVPALPGWGLAVLVVLLSATAGLAVRRLRVGRRMGIADGGRGAR